MSWYSEKAQKLLENVEDVDVDFVHFFSGCQGQILDAGCLTGNFILNAPLKIEGFEIDAEAVEICKQRGFKVKLGALEKPLPYPAGYFGGVYCSHVIEHLNEPILALKEFYRILNKGGKLVVKTPDYLRFWKKFWDDHTHRRPFTKESLKRIAYDVGFRNFKVYPDIIKFRGQRNIMKLIGINNVWKMHAVLRKIGLSDSTLILEAIK